MTARPSGGILRTLTICGCRGSWFGGVHKMIVVVEQYNAHEYSHLMDQMFQMRARVFHDRLRWNVRVVEGRERDKYDDEGPVYLIYTDDRMREVKGSLRLLPTTGPTLLADIFSDTLPAGVHLIAPTILECTRLCLEPPRCLAWVEASEPLPAVTARTT